MRTLAWGGPSCAGFCMPPLTFASAIKLITASFTPGGDGSTSPSNTCRHSGHFHAFRAVFISLSTIMRLVILFAASVHTQVWHMVWPQGSSRGTNAPSTVNSSQQIVHSSSG